MDQFPGWTVSRSISGLYHAEHVDGRTVTAEDDVDLADQIRAAELRAIYAAEELAAS